MAALNYFSGRSLGPEVARQALDLWPVAGAELTHIGTSGNASYRVDGAAGTGPWILRLTDPAHRTHEQCQAEMAFLSHLARSVVRVSVPLPSRAGHLVEAVGELSASLLSWAPGEVVGPGTPAWNEAFFREWGRSLGEIHAAAQTYDGPPRWEWHEENLIAEADRFLPADDLFARQELERLLGRLAKLPRTPESYGMTHADFGPQNFHYDPAVGITSFDFGNCCRHWFLSDLAISFTTLRREPEGDRLRRWIVEGYCERMEIHPAVWGELDTLVQLRVLYVYLSRLEAFGATDDDEQKSTLQSMRGLVASRLQFDWPR